MNLDIPICVVNGFTQDTGDWLIGKYLRDFAGFTDVIQRECVQNLGTADEVKAGDFRPVVLSYSWGGASSKHVFDPLWESAPPSGVYACKLWVGVCCVPDLRFGQLPSSCWHKPRLCRQAVHFGVPGSFPTAEPLKDDNAVWWDFDDVAWLLGAMANTPNGEPKYPSINVNCARLVSDMDPISQHTKICNHTDLLNGIANLLKAVV